MIQNDICITLVLLKDLQQVLQKYVLWRLLHQTYTKHEITELISEGYFSTMTEFVTDAIRKNLDEYRRKRALQTLVKVKGSGKGFVPTRSQRKAAFIAFEQKITNSQDSE